MSKLATRKRNKKNISRFQKLLQRVDRLKLEIVNRDKAIDALAERIRVEIYPREQVAAKANVELLYRLLDLGQRKSWSNWQRQELELWIKDNLHVVAVNNLLSDELRDAVARYDAFRMGVELDENDGRSPGDQLDELIDQHEKMQQQETEDLFADIEKNMGTMIEDVLEQELGPRPVELKPHHAESTLDELQQAYDKYREQRRQELEHEFLNTLNGLKDGTLQDNDDEFDPYQFDEEFAQDFESSDKRIHLDNATIQRLFRSTAAVLHPDREADPDKRLAKQSLMAKLLSARKNGDVLTLLSLHQEHVENGEALSKADEKQLTAALEEQVRELEEELQYYEPTSHFHDMAFAFYSPSKKKLENNLQEHIDDVEYTAQAINDSVQELSSMNALKPILQIRFDHRRQDLMDAYYAGEEFEDY